MLIPRPSRMYRNQRINCDHNWDLFKDSKRCTRCGKWRNVVNMDAARQSILNKLELRRKDG